MKKIISMLLIVAILVSCVAFVEETFTIHSGVSFGMTANEVKKQEKENGFSADWAGSQLLVEGTVAGHQYSRIYYGFSSGKLCRSEYSLPATSWLGIPRKELAVVNHEVMKSNYALMSESLSSKYGVTEYNSITGKRYMVPNEINEYTTSGFASVLLRNSYSWNADYPNTLEMYEQWLVLLDDGSGILIDHSLIRNDNRKSPSDVYWEQNIYYTYLDKTIVETLNVSQEQIINDI